MKTTNKSLKDLTPAATLSQIVSADKQAGNMLSSIGLKPFDHKDETLQAVCRQKQWSEVEVLQWIKNNRQRNTADFNAEKHASHPDYGSNLEQWWQYLDQSRIASTLELLGKLKTDFPRVHQLHGNQYPWLKNITWHFERFVDSLDMYCQYEKQKFYPLAVTVSDKPSNTLHGTINTLKKGVEIIERDQQRLRDFMQTIREKGNRFKNPVNACSTLRILNQNFKMLFSSLEQQFKVEQEHLLPLVKKKIHGYKHSAIY